MVVVTRDVPSVAAQGGEQRELAGCWHCAEPGRETSSGLFQPKPSRETMAEIQSFTEFFRLEKTSKITEPNHQPSTLYVPVS